MEKIDRLALGEVVGGGERGGRGDKGQLVKVIPAQSPDHCAVSSIHSASLYYWGGQHSSVIFLAGAGEGFAFQTI